MKNLSIKDLMVFVFISVTGFLQASTPPPPAPPPPPAAPIDANITVLILFALIFAFYKYNAINTKKS